MNTVAALTIYQGDIALAKLWLRYYGDHLGRDNCYVLCVGDNSDLNDLAQGCSVIRLPPDAAPTLEKKRGRIVNNMVASLLCYHAHVIVTHMDELLLVDPQTGQGLRGYLVDAGRGQVLTPLGLQLVSRGGHETDALAGAGLAPPYHVQTVPELSRPCVLSTATALSRDATLSRFERLQMPDELYLLRVSSNGETPGYGSLPDRDAVDQGFDFTAQRRQMQDSWAKMENSRYWWFQPPDQSPVHLLPGRFHDLL